MVEEFKISETGPDTGGWKVWGWVGCRVLTLWDQNNLVSLLFRVTLAGKRQIVAILEQSRSLQTVKIQEGISLNDWQKQMRCTV